MVDKLEKKSKYNLKGGLTTKHEKQTHLVSNFDIFQ